MDKTRIFKALSWNFIGMLGNQVVLFIIGIILARLLDPEDFGLVAMILVFSNFGQIFIDLGFNNALIQNKTNSQEDLSTLFYVNIVFGLILFFILYFSSGVIASFYNKTELIEITKVISVIFIFFALSSIQRTLVIKNLDFRFETFVLLAASLISGTIAIIFALKGFGVWALVFKVVLQRFFEALFFWIQQRWRPSLIFRLNSIKKYINFSLNVTASTILAGISGNIDKLIIGKTFSADSLGFFDRAKNYNNLVQSNLGLIFGKVMYPVFSEIQDETERFNRIYEKTIQFICFFTLPIFFIMIVVAKPLIVVLITDKWLPSVKMLQILAVSGFTYPLSMVIVKAILSKGRADLVFQLDFIKTILYFIAILLGSKFGILGVLIAITIVNYMSLTLNALALSIVCTIKIYKQLKIILLPFVFSSSMWIFLFIINRILIMNELSRLVTLLGLGTIFYISLNYFFNYGMLIEIKNTLTLIKTINK